MEPLRISTTTFIGLIFMLFLSNVEAEKPTFLRPITEVNVDKGATAVLPCTIKNLNDYKIVWTDQGSTLLTYYDRRIIDDDRISVERPYVTSWDLHIRNAAVSDSGVYKCQVNTSPVMIHRVQLNVLDVQREPEFEDTVTDFTATKGQSVTLSCAVRTPGTKQLTWVRGDSLRPLVFGSSVLHDDPRFKVQYRAGTDGIMFSNLTIHDVTTEDADLYNCVISDMTINNVKTFHLEVADEPEPEFEKGDTELSAGVGQTVTLTCAVRNVGTSTITWLRDSMFRPIAIGAYVFSRDVRYSIDYGMGDNDITSSNLTIRDVTDDDEDTYRCSVSNKRGDYKREIQLEIMSTRFGDTETQVYVEQGTTAVLKCSVQNLANYVVVWSAHGRMISLRDRRVINDGRISVERPDASSWNLHIRNVVVADSGVYKCDINTVPVIEHNVELRVLSE